MEFVLPLPKLDEKTSVSWRSWKDMKQRFKDYIVLKNEGESLSESGFRRVSPSLFMFINGNKIIDILKVFAANTGHKCDEVEELLETIEDICLPSFILLYERFKFFSLRQKEFEDFRKFFSELQMLQNYCELEEQQGKLLTNRIVGGVYNEALRSRLQSCSHLELEEAIQVCVETESGSLDRCLDVGYKESQAEELGTRAHILKEKKDSHKNALTENILPARIGIRGRIGKSKQNKESCRETYSRCDEENKAACRDNAQIVTSTRRQSKRRSLGNITTYPAGNLSKKRSAVETSLAEAICQSEAKIKRSAVETSAEGICQSEAKIKRSDSAGSGCQQHRSSSSLSEKIVGQQSKEETVQEESVNAAFISRDIVPDDICRIIVDAELQSNPKAEFGGKDAQIETKVGLRARSHNQKNGRTKLKKTRSKNSRECPICGQMFATTYLLKCHTRKKSGQRLFNCGICDLSFIHCGSRSRHMRQSHPELLKFPCDECDMLFERQKALDQHKLSHSKQQEVTCNDCGVTFASTREHFQHRRKVHRNTRYHCSLCGLHFPYPSKLKLHLMSKHNATKPFMCEICGSSFSEKNLLTAHKNIHSGEKKHECPTCGRRFLLKTTLSNHIQTHLDRKPHTCEVCGLGFKLSYYLKSHMKTHSQNRDRPHICSKCGRAFLKLAQLRNHERKHTGEKPYKCDICGSLFSQLSSMKKHVRQIHEGVKPKDRFSCEYCGLSFTHSCKLKLHLMKHTGERPFACKICGSTYRENHQLATHMKIHDGSEPFKCLVCERRFLQKSSLESHVRKHTGEKPFKCLICCQQFSHKGYLRDHVKVHDQNRERKYKCSICDKAFTCSSHMRSHERLHLGEKPHKCDICGSRFTKRSSVKKHMRRTHGVQETTSLKVQDSLSEQNMQETSHLSSADVALQGVLAEQHKSGLQDEVLREAQICPETHPELHVNQPAELRPVLHVGIELQMSSELHPSHCHTEASMQSHIEHGMFARLHTIHPLSHAMYSHPSIPIIHPGAHTLGHSHIEPQITPAISSSLCTHVHHPEIVQEMHVYTMAS